MSQVESVAPVIDIEGLLVPISEENPSGESLQYAGVYDEIREARRADLNLGEWQTEIKIADFRKVIDLSTASLIDQTKDLQIGAWFCEALTNQHGFVGFRDGIKLMRCLQENFWDTIYPEIDEGDMEGRANSISWLNNLLSITLKKIPITGGQGLSYFDWEESCRFDFPADFNALEYEEQQKFIALKEQAESEKRKTGDMWRAAKALTNRAFCEQLNLTLAESASEVDLLDRTNEDKYDRNQMPGLRELKKSIEDIRDLFAKILNEKREAEPDPIDEISDFEGVDGESGDGETTVVTRGVAISAGAVQSRADALRRLGEIAEYFRKTEPHSPVSYLVQRAVKWGNMPLENWLLDVIKDQAVISNLRETLGIESNSSEYEDSSY